MSWIKSHQSLAHHRKTLHAVAALHCDRHKLLGHIHELWWWALDNADSHGLLGHTPPQAIAEAAGWPVPRDAVRFVDAMQAAGFLECGAAGFVLHDWFDYSGKLIAQRAKNKARMTTTRAEHKDGTSGARAIAREEERREEENLSSSPSTFPGPAARRCTWACGPCRAAFERPDRRARAAATRAAAVPDVPQGVRRQRLASRSPRQLAAA